MLLTTGALLVYFRRRTSVAALCHGGIFGLTAALGLGFLIGDFNCKFAVPVAGRLNVVPLTSDLRLFAQGLFLEGTLYLLGAGLLSFRAKKKALGVGAALLALIVGAVGVDALLIEPYALDVRKMSIESEKITKPIRIVFVSDVQSDRIGAYERQVFAQIKAQNADLILLGGDYVQLSRSSIVRENRPFDNRRGRFGLAKNLGDDWNRFLKEEKLAAPLGVYAVSGFPHEEKLAADWFAGTGVEYIEKSRALRLTDELALLALTGNDSRSAGEATFPLPTLLQESADSPFLIRLGHVPTHFFHPDRANLLLAGHTHGGQVRLPILGPIFTMTPNLPRFMASGHFRLPQDRLPQDRHSQTQHSQADVIPSDGASADAIVSNGVGMERSFAPRVRFLCRPDFWVIELLPKGGFSQSQFADETSALP